MLQTLFWHEWLFGDGHNVFVVAATIFIQKNVTTHLISSAFLNHAHDTITIYRSTTGWGQNTEIKGLNF